MKRCFKCGKELPLSEFYVHPQMGDGHLGKCKECTKGDVRDRYHDPASRPTRIAYERARFQSPERKAKALVYQRVRRLRYPQKAQSRHAVSNAIRDGKLIRQPCEVCGGKAQAHHEDYSKPFEIRWLCFRHHREIAHSQMVTQ